MLISVPKSDTKQSGLSLGLARQNTAPLFKVFSIVVAISAYRSLITF
jgi:hypothetical protein